MFRGSSRTNLGDESGFALVLALAVVVALGAASTSVAYYSTANFHNAKHSRGDTTALALAEAGLNAAYSVLEHSASPTLASAIPSTPAPDTPMPGGWATYSGSLRGSPGAPPGNGNG